MAVTVYSKPGCVQCRSTINHMRKNKVPFTVVDVTKDDSARERLVSLGYQTMPVVETTDGKSWSGYRYEEIEGLSTTV